MEHHLVSDVPVGLLLSGGLDSSALLALTQRPAATRTSRRFPSAWRDAALDESDAARALARHFGVRHHEMLLTQELARHWIDDFLDAIDQPTLDGFNMYCACKLARRSRLQGRALGPGRGRTFWRLSLLPANSRPASHRAVYCVRCAPAIRGLERLSPGARARRACDYLAVRPASPRAYAAFRGVFTPRGCRLLQAVIVSWPGLNSVSRQNQPEQREAARSNPDLGDAISQLELTRYLRNQLLRDADVMSMAHGVELRVPLLDLPLFATLRAIPSQLRLAPGQATAARGRARTSGRVAGAPQARVHPAVRFVAGERMDATCPTICPSSKTRRCRPGTANGR